MDTVAGSIVVINWKTKRHAVTSSYRIHKELSKEFIQLDLRHWGEGSNLEGVLPNDLSLENINLHTELVEQPEHQYKYPYQDSLSQLWTFHWNEQRTLRPLQPRLSLMNV